MSKFADAFAFLMSNEDASYAYAEVLDPVVGDPEAHAISGVNSAAWPIAFQGLRVTAQSARGPGVRGFYLKDFWTPLNLGLLQDQDLASRVLDCCVDQGPGTGIKLLQRSVNAVRGPTVRAITVDGVLGPKTSEAANVLNPVLLLANFRQLRADAYRAIGGPSLSAWLARAAK